MVGTKTAHRKVFPVTSVIVVIDEHHMSLEMGLPGHGSIKTKLRDFHQSILKTETEVNAQFSIPQNIRMEHNTYLVK